MGESLAELLLGQLEDQALSFWVMVLIAHLTYSHHNAPLVARMGDYQAHYQELLRAQRLLLRPRVLAALVQHLAVCAALEPASMQNSHVKVVEVVLTLLRNLLVLGSEDTPLRAQFVQAMVR